MAGYDLWRRYEIHRLIFVMRTVIWLTTDIFAFGLPVGGIIVVGFIIYAGLGILGLLGRITFATIDKLLIGVDVGLTSLVVSGSGGLASHFFLLYVVQALFLAAAGSLAWSIAGAAATIGAYAVASHGWTAELFWWRAVMLTVVVASTGVMTVSFNWARRAASDTSRQLEQIHDLKLIQQSMVRNDSLDAILSTLLANGIKLVGADAGYIGALDGTGGIRVLSSHNVFDADDPVQWELNATCLGGVIEHRRALFVDNVLTDLPDPDPANPHSLFKKLIQRGYSQLAVAPLESGGEVLGVLGMAAKEGQPKLSANKLVIENLVDIVVTQMRFSQAREDAYKRGQLLAVMERVSRIVNRNLEMPVLLRSLHQAVAEELEVDAFFVVLALPGDSEHAIREYLYDAGDEYPQEILTLKPGSPTATVLATGAPRLYHGVPEAAELVGSREPPRGILITPLTFEGRVIGVISAQSYRVAYDHGHLELLTAVASQAAIAIQNAQLYQKTQQVALTDYLTGLANSRHFTGALSDAITTAQTHHQPLSLLLIDSDSLKQINDRYGHTAGDAHLQMLANVIQRSIRDGDTACRYAGDEFVVILPNSRLKDAVVVGERIRKEMEQQFSWRDHGIIGATISVGAAEYQAPMSHEDLFMAADRAMYEAKQSGKNRVVAQMAGPTDA